VNFDVRSREAEDGVAVLEVQGEADAFTAPRLKQEMLSWLDRGTARIAVNLAEVTYLDSTGLGALIGGLKRARERDGDLVLVCPNERIMRIFDITGLARIFEIFYTEEDAIVHLRGSQDG
jgi:anti-sigma B factor antagonist